MYPDSVYLKENVYLISETQNRYFYTSLWPQRNMTGTFYFNITLIKEELIGKMYSAL